MWLNHTMIKADIQHDFQSCEMLARRVHNQSYNVLTNVNSHIVALSATSCHYIVNGDFDVVLVCHVKMICYWQLYYLTKWNWRRKYNIIILYSIVIKRVAFDCTVWLGDGVCVRWANESLDLKMISNCDIQMLPFKSVFRECFFLSAFAMINLLLFNLFLTVCWMDGWRAACCRSPASPAMPVSAGSTRSYAFCETKRHFRH